MKISIIFLVFLFVVISIHSTSALPHRQKTDCGKSGGGRALLKKSKLIAAALIAKALIIPKLIIGGLIVKKIIKKKLIKDAIIGGAALLLAKKFLKRKKACGSCRTTRVRTIERFSDHSSLDEHHSEHSSIGHTAAEVKPIENTATEVQKESDHKLAKRSISDMVKRNFERVSDLANSAGNRFKGFGDFFHKQSDRLREASLTTRIAGLLAAERVKSMGALGRFA